MGAGNVARCEVTKRRVASTPSYMYMRVLPYYPSSFAHGQNNMTVLKPRLAPCSAHCCSPSTVQPYTYSITHIRCLMCGERRASCDLWLSRNSEQWPGMPRGGLPESRQGPRSSTSSIEQSAMGFHCGSTVGRVSQGALGAATGTDGWNGVCAAARMCRRISDERCAAMSARLHQGTACASRVQGAAHA